jgi:hypothetical protein
LLAPPAGSADRHNQVIPSRGASAMIIGDFEKEADVPIAVRIAPQNMSREDYEKLIDELERTGSAEPEGRVFHAGYGED